MRITELFEQLLITPEMLVNAKKEGHQVFVLIDCKDFLLCTTNKTLPKIVKSAKTVSDYNEYAKTDPETITPYLRISLKDNKILGHEGRHRAVALLKEGNEKMPCTLKLVPSSKERKKYGNQEAPFLVNFDDLPESIQGQFDRGTLFKSNLVLVKNGWNNL